MDEAQEAAVVEAALDALPDDATARQIMQAIKGYNDNAIDIAIRRLSAGGGGGSGGWVGPFVYRAMDTIYISVTADGGTFTLTVNGQTTAPIAWDADLATMLAAIIALPNVTASDVGFDNGPGNIGFALGFLDSPVTADATNLTGVGHGVAISYSDRIVALHDLAEGDILQDAAGFTVTAFDDSGVGGPPQAFLVDIEDDTPPASAWTPLPTAWALNDTSSTPRLYTPNSTVANYRAGVLEALLDDANPGAWLVMLPTVALQACTVYLVANKMAGDGTEGEIHVYLNVSTPTGGMT